MQQQKHSAVLFDRPIHFLAWIWIVQYLTPKIIDSIHQRRASPVNRQLLEHAAHITLACRIKCKGNDGAILQCAFVVEHIIGWPSTHAL
jgi:hypothetical protein